MILRRFKRYLARGVFLFLFVALASLGSALYRSGGDWMEFLNTIADSSDSIPAESLQEAILRARDAFLNEFNRGRDLLHYSQGSDYQPIHGAPVTEWPHFDLQNLDNGLWTVGYSNAYGSPLWVSYVARASKQRSSGERPEGFNPDSRVGNRVTSEMYTGSGFDRGHLFSNYIASVSYGPEVQRDSFLMSNITPQAPEFNRGGVWRAIEEKVGYEYRHDFGEVHVLTGPVYDLRTRGSYIAGGRIRVPEAFWKILLVEKSDGKREALAFLMPHGSAEKNPEHYLVSIDRIEELTQLDFFSELEDQAEEILEGHKSARIWR